MKRLIEAIAITAALAIVAYSGAIASGVSGSTNATYTADSGAYPNPDNFQKATHHLELQSESGTQVILD